MSFLAGTRAAEFAFTARATVDRYYSENETIEYTDVLTNVGDAYDPAISECFVIGCISFVLTYSQTQIF